MSKLVHKLKHIYQKYENKQSFKTTTRDMKKLGKETCKPS